MRPFEVLTSLSRKEWNHWNGVPVQIRKEIDGTHWNLGHPSVQQMEKLIRQVEVSGETTEALAHFFCDSCNRLKQPPGRRQVALAPEEIFNDAVSMDVNFWQLKERNSRGKRTVTVLNIVCAASGTHTLWKIFAHGFGGLVRPNVSEWIAMMHKGRNSLTMPKDEESWWTGFLLAATGT